MTAALDASTARARSAAALAPYVPRLALDWAPDAGGARCLAVEGTLLSADLSGFTALSERLAGLGKEGAEELTDLLNTCFTGMIAQVDVHGGDILKFGGDALLILFAGPDHAARACRAAVAMREVVAQPLQSRNAGRVRLKISQGMHTGSFSLYAVSGGAHTELVVTGPAATETVECEGIANAGQILLSPETAASVDRSWLGPEREGRRLLRRVDVAAHEIDLRGARAAEGVDPEVVERLLPAAQRAQINVGAPSEHRRVAVAFLKFSHTDHLEGAEGRDAVAARLQHLAEVVEAAVEIHGVHWLASDLAPDGGKLILAAGAPTGGERDEDALLRATRTILDGVQDLDVRVGVNCGPVFVGDLGSPSRRTFTVMGDAVNLAARLMQKAGTGQLVASRAVVDRSHARFSLEWLEPFLVKGKAKPIHAALVGRLEGQHADVGTERLPIVGREAELALLRRAISDLRDRHGGLADVVGEAGSGKTRLVDELRGERDLRTITVICGQYARTTAYFVIRLLLRSLAGVELHTPSAEAGVALTRLVEEQAPHLRPWVPLLAIPFDADVPPTPESSDVAPAYRRERVHQVVADLLTAVVTTPSMVVVEDAHWIDDASRDLLQLVAEVAAERPWLVCLTRRPGEPVLRAPEGATSVAVELEPLGSGAALELAVAAAGDESRLRPGDWERLVARAAGNPMFVIELVSSAVEHGGADALPESVESLVTARIDTVAAEDRLLLREAAVLGMVVELDLLADALEQASLRDEARWERLDAFLAPLAAGRLTFRHGLYRQVAYEGLSYRRRREAHRRVGEAIEARTLDGSDVDAELLSTHFDRAGAHDRAWRYSRVAGDRARAKYANVEAAEFYERALDNAPRVPSLTPAELAVVAEALGDVSELAGRYDDAARAYAHARRRLPREGHDAARLLHKEGVVRERSGRYADALRWYSRGLRVVEQGSGDERAAASLRAELALAYAGVRYRQGRYRDQVRWAERAAADAASADDRAALAHAYYLLDLGYTSLARPEQAHYRGRALPIYEELGDHVGRCNVLNNLGIVAYHAGEWNDAVASYDRAREAAEQAGDVVGAATGENNIGEILSDQGRLAESVPLFRLALRVFRSAHYPVGVAVATANLGRAEARAGEHGRALTLLEDAVARFEELRAAAFVFDTRVRVVEALVLAGRHDDALAVGSSLAERLGAAGDELPKLQLVRALGWARLRTGDAQGAAACFDDAIRRAEGIDARYERALSQLGRAEAARMEGDAEGASHDEADARRVLDDLGVVTVPHVP